VDAIEFAVHNNSMSSFNVVFVGNDSSYYNRVAQVISSYSPGLNLSFSTLSIPVGDKFKNDALKLFYKNPQFIFLDLSSDPDTQVRFCQLLSKSLPFSQIPLVGMLDTTLEVKYKRKIIGSGIWALHIKGLEVEGSAYLFKAFLDKEKANFPTFATSNLEFRVETSVYVRIGLITPQYIHVESDFDFPLEKTVSLLTNLNDEFPFSQFKIIRKFTSNLYYHFSYSYDLEYALGEREDFYGKFPTDDKTDSNEIKIIDQKGKEKDRNSTLKKNIVKPSQKFSNLKQYMKLGEEGKKDLILKQSRFLEEWPKTWPQTRFGKRSRLLIIDQKLSVLTQSKVELDEYSFSISAHAMMDSEVTYIERIMAGIIVYVLPEKKIVKLSSQENEDLRSQKFEIISKIVNKIKSFSSYRPILVLFNVSLQDRDLLKRIDYKQLLIHETPFDFDLCLQYSQLYEEKGGRLKTHDQSKSYFHKEKRWYLSKNLVRSYGKLKIEIKIISFSEFILEFISPIPIPDRAILRFEKPFSMFVTVFCSLGKNDENIYRGIIHGVSELTKVKIRQTINGLIAEVKFQENEEEE